MFDPTNNVLTEVRLYNENLDPVANRYDNEVARTFFSTPGHREDIDSQTCAEDFAHFTLRARTEHRFSRSGEYIYTWTPQAVALNIRYVEVTMTLKSPTTNEEVRTVIWLFELKPITERSSEFYLSPESTTLRALLRSGLPLSLG